MAAHLLGCTAAQQSSPLLIRVARKGSFCCRQAVGGSMFEVSQVSVFIRFSVFLSDER